MTTLVIFLVGMNTIFCQNIRSEEATELVNSYINCSKNNSIFDDEEAFLVFYPPSGIKKMKEKYGENYSINDIGIDDWIIHKVEGTTVVVFSSNRRRRDYWTRKTVFEVIYEEDKLCFKPLFSEINSSCDGKDCKMGFISPWLSSKELEEPILK
jgi:hypothetical protein